MVFLALEEGDSRITPAKISERFGTSSSYLSKVLRVPGSSGFTLVRTGPIRGILSAREPEGITLLDVVEACQGVIAGNYCQELVQKSGAARLCLSPSHGGIAATSDDKPCLDGPLQILRTPRCQAKRCLPTVDFAS